MWEGSEGGWKCRVAPARAELAHGSPAAKPKGSVLPHLKTIPQQLSITTFEVR